MPVIFIFGLLRHLDQLVDVALDEQAVIFPKVKVDPVDAGIGFHDGIRRVSNGFFIEAVSLSGASRFFVELCCQELPPRPLLDGGSPVQGLLKVKRCAVCLSRLIEPQSLHLVEQGKQSDWQGLVPPKDLDKSAGIVHVSLFDECPQQPKDRFVP